MAKSDNPFERPSARVVEIEITPDGEFVKHPGQRPLWLARFFRIICALALIATVAAFATAMFWLAVLLLPLVILSGLSAWAYLRFGNRL